MSNRGVLWVHVTDSDWSCSPFRHSGKLQPSPATLAYTVTSNTHHKDGSSYAPSF